MTKCKLEYIWLDGYQPTQSLRSKTKIVDDFSGNVEDAPMWGFDGSSTQQAPGGSSDCLLKPVYVCEDPARLGTGYLVMCEVLNHDGTPHKSNGRSTIADDDDDFWFGFEQEYTIWDPETNKPIGFPAEGYPSPQGPYYCSVGTGKAVGREIVEEHLELCLQAGLNVEGINAEVAKGQWEFQIFGKGAHKACDQVWVARYILQRLCEKYGVDVEYHCKPYQGDWNGSGMHCNFSTEYMRETGGKDYFLKLMDKFEEYKDEHIAAYGPDNHMRLTGLHETQSIDKFSWGVADRGASIRVPHSFVKDDAYKGYLEDRRPNSQGDPYQIVSRVSQTVAEVEADLK